MKRINSLISCFTFCVLCMFSGGSIFAQGLTPSLPLVAETDFSSSTKDPDAAFASMDEVDGFGKSVITPHVSTNLTIAKTLKTTATKSDFLSKVQYAVTPNPIRLDSIRFDDNNDSGEWGFVVSGGSTAQGQKMLTLDVSGVKDGGRYRVEVDFCNPFNTSENPPGYAAQIRIGVNNGPTSQGQDVSQANTKIQRGGCTTATLSGPTQTQELMDIANNRLTVNIFIGQMQANQAIMIKKIRVYAEVEPAIVGLNTVCAGGETSHLSADNTYLGCTMQWYRDGVKLNGETGTTYTHKSVSTLGEGQTKKYTYSYKVTTPNGDVFTSSDFVVTDKVCCIGDDGQMASRKMIWQDDFGTFTSAKNYWTWDYSNLADPKKVQHTDGKNWSTCTEVAFDANAECKEAPSGEGQYTVAANVTCAYDNVQGGTQWGWEAYFGNGKQPKQNGWTYIPDHTYGTSGEYGGMLFLNCNNEHDKPIYVRPITGLCQKHLTLTCYVNTFSDSKNPVDIYIQVKDLTSGKVHKSSRVTKSATGSKEWVAAEVDVDLEGTDLELSIVSYGGDGANGIAEYNKYGNDLVLDDIQIFACSQPAINIFFDPGLSVTEAYSCEGKELGLYVNETDMIKTNLGGEAYYVYQFSTTPDDSKSWQTIAGPVKDITYLDLSSTYDPSWRPGKQVYYRCILGEKRALEDEIANYGYFRPNAPCGEFSVSTPIIATKECIQCYESAKPIISADGGRVDNRKKTVHLCYGESTTLTSNDVISKDKDGNPYDNYTMSWHANDASSAKIKAGQGTVAVPYEVTWDKADKNGTKYILKVHDNVKDERGNEIEYCDTYDTITIFSDTLPVAPKVKIPEFCQGLASDNVDVTTYLSNLASSLSGYNETIEDVAGNKFDLSNFLTELDNLTSGNVTFSIFLEDDDTKCLSDTQDFVVTIHEIPVEPITEDKDYVMEEGKTQSLAETASLTDQAYKLQWEPTTKSGSENLSAYVDVTPTISLSVEDTFYYYVRQVNAAGCEGPGKKVTVTVNSAQPPIAKDTVVCKGSTVDLNDRVSTTESTYELHWYNSASVTPDGSGSPTAPNVSTDVPGVYEFYVTQQSTVSPYPESKIKTVKVEVVDVYEPDTVGNTYHYCSNDTPVDLVAKLNKDESKSFYADEVVWRVNGGTESTTKPTVNTNVSTTTTYEYTAYQTATIMLHNQKRDVCKGNPVTWSVEVTYVPALATTDVTYMKADAENGTFAKNVMEQSGNEAIVNYASTMKLWWYEKDCSTKVGDGRTAPTPKVDPNIEVGKDQPDTFCVKQEVAGCLSEGTPVPVLISDAPKPTPTDYVYCKGAASEKLTTKPDMSIKPNATYILKWYGNGDRGDYTDLHLSGDEGPAPTTNMRAGDNGKSEYFYYVTQTEIVNGQEGAESNKTEIKVTVYDQTNISIDNSVLGAVCKPATVDIARSVSFTNEVANLNYETKYYKDQTLGEETSTNVGESGEYYVQTSFTVTAKSNSATCVSDPTMIPVTVDTLQVRVENVGTCPDMEAKFEVHARTNTTGVKYTWNGITESDPNGGIKTDSVFTTKMFAGANYGDEFMYSLLVEAGTCTFSADTMRVTLGEGPVTGTMTVTEEGNSYTPNTFTDTKFNEFYSCGDSLKIKADYHEADGTAITDYTWYDGTRQIGTGAELKLPETDNSGDRIYRVNFTNGCPTNVTITIHYRPIKVTPLSTKVTKLCEGEEFNAEVDTKFADGETPEYKWYRNGVEVEMGSGTSLDVTRKKLTIGKVKTTDSGRYTFLMTNRGCEARAELDSLVAMPYIVATEKIDTIVPRHSNPNIELDVTVPAGGAGVDYEWKGSRGENETTNPLSLTDVTSDHYYEVTMKAVDHCDASAIVDVKVDAKLTLKTTLKDTICTGLSAVLTIDTTGTGKFRHEDWNRSLTVTVTTEGVTSDLTGSVTRDGDLLKLTVSPTATATYKISFVYGPQDTTATELLYVIPAIGVTIPEAVTICEGEATDIMITDIQPEGTVIKWNADTTILTETLDTSIVRVKPVYLGGTNHQYQYAYDFVAYNTFCNSSVPYTAYVKVDEPLEGEILGDRVICETFSSRLDASSYAATTYVWTVEGDTVNQGASMTVTPKSTTNYHLSMDRGTCHREEELLLTVKTNPVIVDMDSVDIRNREVILKDGAGEEPFNFWVDDLVDSRTIDPVLYNLKFSKHTAHVSDKNGCVGEYLFEVPAPGLTIPEYFTPNADGINDTWLVPELPIVYPNAVVRIYDRFGKLLAEYYGAKEDGWDGTYNGHAMQSTDYWYVIDVEEIDRQFLGHFTLIRQ